MDFSGKANIPNCAYPYAFSYTINFVSKGCDHSTLSHFWSLSVEEHFYIFWPLIFLLGNRFSFIVSIVLVAACLKFGTVAYSFIDNWYPNRWTFPAMLPILCGCITALVHKAPGVSSVFAEKSSSSIVLIAIFAGLCSPAFTRAELPWIMSMCSLLLYIKFNQDSRLVRLLEFRPLALIGVISYGLYVWQGVFTGNGPYRTGAAFPPPLYTGLWITFIVAPLSYIFFERPLLRIKDRYSWRHARRDNEQAQSA
ncbi:O-acetyltransferase OatA [compost metagenome]